MGLSFAARLCVGGRRRRAPGPRVRVATVVRAARRQLRLAGAVADREGHVPPDQHVRCLQKLVKLG